MRVKDNLAHTPLKNISRPGPLSRFKRQDSLYTQLYCMAELNQLFDMARSASSIYLPECLNKNFSNTFTCCQSQARKRHKMCMNNNTIKSFGTTLLLQTNSAVYPSSPAGWGCWQHPQSCKCMNLHSQGGGATLRTAVRATQKNMTSPLLPSTAPANQVRNSDVLGQDAS